MAARIKMMMKKFYDTKLEGLKSGIFDIALVTEDNYEHFYVLLKAPTSLYGDQYHVFEIRTTYGNNEIYQYPMTFPKVQFLTSIFHTNINDSGTICLDILKDKTKWMPSYSLYHVIENIALLLRYHNPSSPMVPEAGKLFEACEYKYVKGSSRLTATEAEEYERECFKAFREKSDKIYYASQLKKFHSYFPQLTKKLTKEQIAEEITTIETTLASMKPKVEKLVEKPAETSDKPETKVARWKKRTS
jgi:ubiquitin-protein ligase